MKQLFVSALCAAAAALGYAYVVRRRKQRALAPLQPCVLGFDLDHTLARYYLRPTLKLIYESLRKYLVQNFPNCPQLAESFDETWCIKGIVVDFATGDFLWICEDGHVRKARHGAGPFFTPEQIYAKYGNRPWAHFNILASGSHSAHFFSFITYFEIPASHLCAQLIDHCDENKLSYSIIRTAIISAFTHNFSPEAFKLGRGTYFPAVIANPDSYIMERKSVRRWLEAKRTNGHTLFLLTNSHADYTNLLCSTSLGPDWRQLFDLVVVHAMKPSFFKPASNDMPFIHVELENNVMWEGLDASVEEVVCDRVSIFAKGNLKVLQRALLSYHFKVAVSQVPNCDGHITYFGDHLIGDVQEVSKHTNWHIVAVAEEMECSSDHLESNLPSHSSSLSQLILHPREWGSFFHIESQRSHWHNVLRLHASLVIPDVALCEAIEQSQLAHWFEPHNLPLAREALRTADKGLKLLKWV